MRLTGRSFETFRPFHSLSSSLSKPRHTLGFIPHEARRGISTLTIKSLTRTLTADELFSMSLRGVLPTVNQNFADLKIWGRDVYFEKGKEYNFATVTQNDVFSINKDIIIDGETPILFKDEGFRGIGTALDNSYREMRLDSIKELESSDPDVGRDQRLRFPGIGCYYDLTYSIRPITPQEAGLPLRYVVPDTPSPTKGIIRIKSVICFITTESVEDDLIIKIFDLNGLVKKLPQVHIVKGEVKHFNMQPDTHSDPAV